jgi:putative ABC transport system ATP-binding protein
MDAMLSEAKDAITSRPAADLVRLVQVRKVFGRDPCAVHALHDISLQVGAGEMVAVCGPSGSGKTTLLNLVAMLEQASDGNVVIANLLVSKLSEQGRAALRADLIGLVFQSFNLIPVMTARENVLLPLVLRGRMDHAELANAEQRATELLGQLGLATHASHYPPRLDASQCQRVAIARALIARPRLVLADEPTSRLDTGCMRLVMDLFGRCQQDYGTAFLLSTRDQRQFSRATRTLQLNEGRLMTQSTDTARRPLRVPV